MLLLGEEGVCGREGVETEVEANWSSLNCCRRESAPSMASKVDWLVAFRRRSFGSWQYGCTLVGAISPSSLSFPGGKASIASERLRCFSSTLCSMSCTDPKASRADSERLWS